MQTDCVTLVLAGAAKGKGRCCEKRKGRREMSNVTLWGSYPSPAAGVGTASSHRQGFSTFFSLWTRLVFQPRHRLLDRGLPLPLSDLLLLIPAVDHGPPWVHRQLKGSQTYTLAINQGSSTTQPRDRMAAVWRETKLLPPLCKGPQLTSMDFPDGHQRDQASCVDLCVQPWACKVRGEKLADRDSAKG